MKFAVSGGALALTFVLAIGAVSSASARNYDCAKPANANKAACKTAASAGPVSAPIKPVIPVAAAAPVAGGFTAQCKDGTAWSGKLKMAACSGHKGVQSWTGAAAPVPHTPFAKAAPAMKAAPLAMAPGGGAGQVWVNTKSKVYHCSSDPYYGKTKSGQYMTETAALSAGAHADHGKACH